jgi:tetratricopeptide (TPR) repeat protein
VRTIIVFLSTLALTSSSLSAYEVGEIVVPTQNIEVKADGLVVFDAAAGAGLQVLKVEGDRLWVWGSGWIDAQDVVSLGSGVEYFTDEIARRPKSPDLYAARGNVWIAKREFDKAIQDFDQALKIAPFEAAWYCGRANAHSEKHDTKLAISDYTAAIKLQPDKYCYNSRGFCYLLASDYGNAVADLEKAIELDRDYLLPTANLAYIRACCPDAHYRDGNKAVSLATKACDGDKYLDPENLHVLACANAEKGDFTAAIRWEKKAIELNPADKANALKAYSKALQSFEKSEPFHEMSSLE